MPLNFFFKFIWCCQDIRVWWRHLLNWLRQFKLIYLESITWKMAKLGSNMTSKVSNINIEYFFHLSSTFRWHTASTLVVAVSMDIDLSYVANIYYIYMAFSIFQTLYSVVSPLGDFQQDFGIEENRGNPEKNRRIMRENQQTRHSWHQVH